LQRRAYTKNPCVTDPNKPCETRVDLPHFRVILAGRSS
jgi:hypothetical protein